MGRIGNVDVKVDGKTYSLPNHTPVNARLKDTAPALVLFAFRTLGHGAADKNKRPAMLEYDKRQRELIGAQSMITDTTQGLFDLAQKQGFSFKGCDLDRKKLQHLVSEYTRSFQLAAAFCRTADCGYDMMYEDLSRFIRMGGGEPELRTLDDPKEAALMLYAISCGFARDGKEDALAKKLRDYADKAGACEDIGALQKEFGRDMAFQRDLGRRRQLAADNNRQGLVAAVGLLEATLPACTGHRHQAEQGGKAQAGQGM